MAKSCKLEDDEEGGEGDNTDEDDDSAFYEGLEARTLYEVPKNIVTKLKREYHPKRRCGDVEAKRLNKPLGSYITDSESESDDSCDSDLDWLYVRE